MERAPRAGSSAPTKRRAVRRRPAAGSESPRARTASGAPAPAPSAELAPRLVAHARPDVNKAVGPREAPEAVAVQAARGRSSTGGELARAAAAGGPRELLLQAHGACSFWACAAAAGRRRDVGETSSDAASASRCRMGKAAANEALWSATRARRAARAPSSYFEAGPPLARSSRRADLEARFGLRGAAPRRPAAHLDVRSSAPIRSAAAVLKV